GALPTELLALPFANPAPPSQPERHTRFSSCQRFKSPRAASNFQFERPWDRLVPAKSVRKLTALIVVSKKFLVENWPLRKGCRLRCPQRIQSNTSNNGSAEESTLQHLKT